MIVIFLGGAHGSPKPKQCARSAHQIQKPKDREGATRPHTTPLLTLGPHIRHRVAQASQGILTNMFEHVDAQRIVRVYEEA